jgi:hypothetical protein
MSDFQQGGVSAVELAQAQIYRWLDEYGKGISNRRREAEALAAQGKFLPGEVEALFDDAEDLRRAEVEARRAQEAKPYTIKAGPGRNGGEAGGGLF